MRIVHVVCTEAFAGVERHISRLAAAQAASGHSVVVVGGHPSAMTADLDEPGVRHVGGSTVSAAARALVRLRDTDVVNVHMTAAEVAAALALPARQVPVVSTRHFAKTRGSSVLSRWPAKAAARRVRAQIAVSQFVSRHIEGPSTVIHAGVPALPDIVPAARRRPVVLMAQRLEREKATDLALRAFASSGLAGEGWTLDVAGGGAMRPALEKLAHELGVGRAVRFLGHRGDIDRLMNESAVLLASAPDEPYGLSVVEAMAHGLPVIATASGGHLETLGVVDDATLFAPGEVADAAAHLRTLAADADLRDRYGRALHHGQVRRLTVEEQARRTEAVYESVL
jgi:glycosyltransferase involved in cell wall biosynthesis